MNNLLYYYVVKGDELLEVWGKYALDEWLIYMYSHLLLHLQALRLCLYAHTFGWYVRGLCARSKSLIKVVTLRQGTIEPKLNVFVHENCIYNGEISVA